MGRVLVLLGVVLIVVGVIAMALERMQVPLGRLPGDLSWRGRGWGISFPVVTCLVITVVVNLVIWVFGWLRR